MKLVGASLVELAESEITKRIDEGRYPDGERLVIDQLAREFGISIVPIREALARLHAQHLLEFRPNKGYSVAPAPSADELASLFDARLALEIGALELSMNKVSSTTIDNMARFNAEIAASDFAPELDDYRRFAQLNSQFHFELLSASQNKYLIESYNNFGYHQRISRTLSGLGVHDIDLIVKEHDQIVEALRHRDSDLVASAIKTHFIRSKSRFLELVIPEPRAATH